jgi:hypothetical protein
LLLVVRSDLASFRLSFVQDCLLRPLGGVALCHIKMIQQPQVIGRFKPLKHVITLRLCRPIAYVNVRKLQFAESLFACSVRLSQVLATTSPITFQALVLVMHMQCAFWVEGNNFLNIL